MDLNDEVVGLVTAFGAPDALAHLSPEDGIEDIARLLARGPLGVPCEVCGRPIQSERRRLTCSPACLDRLVARRWKG